MSDYPKSRDRPHGRCYRYWDKLPAWRTLTSRGRDLVMFVLRAYHPDKHNAFELSDGTVAAMLKCSPNTARKTIGECIERGWFVLERGGGIGGSDRVRSRVVSLSQYETATRKSQRGRYEHWEAKQPQADNALPYMLEPFSGERRKKRCPKPQKMRRAEKSKTCNPDRVSLYAKRDSAMVAPPVGNGFAPLIGKRNDADA
tara:strand:+ start:17159 stop:17758 length:600 start_codon:yes stop_codon:yes gene_type:complete